MPSLPRLPIPNVHLGHDAAFVWPAYALSALVLSALALDSLLRARRWRREAEGRPPEAGGHSPVPGPRAPRGES